MSGSFSNTKDECRQHVPSLEKEGQGGWMLRDRETPQFQLGIGMMLRLLIVGFGLFAFTLPLCAQSSGSQSSEDAEHPDLTPGPLEMSVERSFMNMSAGTATGYGIAARIGYRPAGMLRRILLEVYGLHAPKDRDPYNRTPQVSTVGIASSILLRDAHRSINPYLMLGGGVYHVDAQKRPPCRPEDGCFRGDGGSFRDATLPSVLMNAGLYLTIIPRLAVRAGAQLYIPFRSPDRVLDSSNTRPTLSIGMTVRL